MSAPLPSPAVVLVTCNGGAWVHRAVASLRRQTLPPQRIVLAVSHSRPIDLPDGDDCTVLRRPEPSGFAPTANMGLHSVPTGPVVVLNDDTEAAPGFLAALVAARVTHGPGIYQPRIALAAAPDGVDRIDNTGHRLFFDGFNLARERGLPTADSKGPPCGEVGAFSGAAVLLSREVIDATGGFDSDLNAFGEDLDLSLRARRLGFRIRFVDDALIRHALGASYGRTGTRKVYLIERNRTRAAVRSLPRVAVATLPLWTGLRLAAVGSAALIGRGVGSGVGLRGAAAAMLGGLAGLATAPDAWRKRDADRPHWTTTDREMWGHLLRHHARPEDLFARGRHV